MTDKSAIATAQKRAAQNLRGQWVRFNHEGRDVPGRRVLEVSDTGMISIDGSTGWFAPHLFVVVTPPTTDAAGKPLTTR